MVDKMIKLIVALDQNLGLAKGGKIPWHCKEDLQFFKDTTYDSVVIMGNNTWKTLSHQLVDRINIVIRNQYEDNYPVLDDKGLRIYSPSIESAIRIAKKISKKDIYIIGGKSIYEQCLKLNIIDECIISYLDADYNCDLFLEDVSKYGFELYKTKELSTSLEVVVGYYTK